jgi:mono/diheme cytochrome c family protein
MRRRTALLLVLLVGTLGLAAAGCGGGSEKTATPDTTEGSLPTQTTDTETTTSDGGEPEGDPAAGKEVFTGASGCGGCHTLADANASGTVGPNFDETQPSYELAVDRVTNGLGSMPSFSGTLSEEDIQNVAAYVSSVAGQ